ncbi:ribosomal protein S12 methylthiotransferase accessory factor [Arcanobacterium pluranimalium]|uniref:YcaO-like family protein n=1 Tax=Arcanobacterium pluranimalium TaxID=108028 RepID=UPI00195B77A2|nr:YcaO-like family protein [Arcanobacterium pluranimalium]MBM7825785.1 ribosomal protein S12 methylthiotransferase accessory factor [Arcanobacterium pluranimalium]
MLTICTELRPLTSEKSLLTCADGTNLILNAQATDIAQVIDQAQNNCSPEILGAPLFEKLTQHHSIRKLDPHKHAQRPHAQPLVERPPTAQTSQTSQTCGNILICGDAALGTELAARLQKLTKLAKLDVQCTYSDLTPRECAYEAFHGGTLIVCRSNQSKAVFCEELSTLNELNVSWIPIDYSGISLLVGPAVIDGDGASYHDCVARERGNAIDHEVYLASLQPAMRGNFLEHILNCPQFLDECAQLISQIHTERSVDTQRNGVVNTVWELHPGGALNVHPVLPRHFVNPPAHQSVKHPQTFVVDTRFGLVRELTEVKHSAYMPPTLHTTQARTTDLTKISGYVNTVFCQGSSIIPPDASPVQKAQAIENNFYAAIGESVERYCSNLIDIKPVTYASYNQLRKRGYPALDPAEIVLFSQRQYAHPGFPFVPFSRDLEIGWVEGMYADDEAPVFVPASLVYVNWHTRQNSHEPRINFPAFAGVAAGATAEQAILSGVSEVIERHATMVWWLNSFALPHIVLSDAQRRLFDGAQETLRAGLINLDNTFDIPVAAGVIHNDTSKLVHVGFSCRASIEEAALKAWSEALTLQEGAHDLKNPHGTHWAAIRSGLLPGRSYKAWRADRKYLDDFRDDLKDVDDLLVQQEVFLDPRAVDYVAPLLDREATRLASTVTPLADNSLSSYRAKIEARGNRLITVDITSPDVSACAMRVIRSIIPGTVGNTPAAFPYLGNDVVVTEAVKLGWRDKPLPEENINHFPMPHA